MKKNYQVLLKDLTLEEKAGLCSGGTFWDLRGVDRLGIPEIALTDGPHGLRKQRRDQSDHLGFMDSEPAICFPPAVGLASSWDRELVYQVGEALGEECLSHDVSVLLGPGINIKRSPLCGRNFEYFSEDPYLTAQMGAEQVKGTQSKGVGTSLKHFAVNNQETRRMTIDAKVSERALREIYLAAFEHIVKEAQPTTIMTSYNKVNGEYVNESKHLLQEVLRDEWGFEGVLVSDWLAVDNCINGIKAGHDVEMPTTGNYSPNKIVQAVKSGELLESELDKVVLRILALIDKTEITEKHGMYDQEAHHEFARQVAAETMVLLKNDDNILPLSQTDKVLLIGDLAQKPRYQGSGSSHIIPTKIENLHEELTKLMPEGSLTFTRGYEAELDVALSNHYLEEACELARQADKVILHLGLPARYEAEGLDRSHLNLPENQLELLSAVSSFNSNVIVVLSNGSAIDLSWDDQVKSILEAYLGGQASGGAIADILVGKVNPSAKLAESFPERLQDVSCYRDFPGVRDETVYTDDIFVGYRHYDKVGLPARYSFGHGLSYTNFTYSGLTISSKKMAADEQIEVTVTVTNTGQVRGKEIVQLYVLPLDATVPRPIKELKGFDKVALEPNESKDVTFVVNQETLKYFDSVANDWYVASGQYQLAVGKSAEQLLLKTNVTVENATPLKATVTRNTPVRDVAADPKKYAIARELFETWYSLIVREKTSDNDKVDTELGIATYNNMPLRGLINFSQGQLIDDEKLDELITKLNAVQ
ncbi:beta-glucosidase [Vagococcus intermedius]|uniref:Glycoside hydrolase family 3 C-terminal domain-containing protein n=1 Tax=Vagococcus intermedius TaxID=2991418 RepID=A0AAF0CWH9_9ENTE|nr:glycoside hydrolase family 3 C-terminal domain-containing protein [Vagococcus intermedius]WEG73987.1 glycoside hydrolase family 3 C-terminal domain-containing protein [Vagococcus intermedius]WEG76067.1 glycoside hydrolase family 3 C-terminal domain-containing protein [Vagococcus intermedius]